jgi:hypothetical protein
MVLNYTQYLKINITNAIVDNYMQKTKNIRIMRYKEGQEIKDHLDIGFSSNRASCTINLNSNYEGGEFSFFSGKHLLNLKKRERELFSQLNKFGFMEYVLLLKELDTLLIVFCLLSFMKLMYNLKDKLFWIHNFLPNHEYKSIHNEIFKERKKLKYQNSSKVWHNKLIENLTPPNRIEIDSSYFDFYKTMLFHQPFVKAF